MRIAIDGRNLVHRKTGIARYFMDLCEGLSTRDHELSFYLPAGPHTDYDLSFATKVRKAKYENPISRIYWQDFVVPRWVEADKPDVFWGPAHRLPKFSRTNVPTVLTIHDLVWRQVPETMPWYRRFGERLQMPKALQSADVICVNSSSTRADLIAFQPKLESKIRLVPPLVNPSSFGEPELQILERANINGDYFLFVGTNEPRKNLSRLVEAFAAAFRTTDRKPLLVICGGQGWKTGSAEELAVKHGILDLVRITGYVSDAELSALYQNATCLVAPSLHEGFGLPIIEANFFGTPVITSNIAAMPEVGGKAAIFVDPNSTAAIADALQTLHSDKKLRLSLARKAKANGRRFNTDAAVSAMETALAHTIKIHAEKNEVENGLTQEGVDH